MDHQSFSTASSLLVSSELFMQFFLKSNISYKKEKNLYSSCVFVLRNKGVYYTVAYMRTLCPALPLPPLAGLQRLQIGKMACRKKKKKKNICSVFQYGNSYADSQTLAWHRPTKYRSVCISRAAVSLKEFPIQASHYRFPAPFLSTAITDLSSPLTFNSFLASLFTPI